MASKRPKLMLKPSKAHHSQPHRTSLLLTLPTELLTQILTYVVTPTSHKLHLLPRDALPFFYYESSPSTDNTVTLLPTTTSSTTTFTANTTTNTTTIADTYKSRFRPFFPSTLLISHHLHDLTLHILHTTTILHISLGHRLAADATLNVRHALRVRSASRERDDGLLSAKERRADEARRAGKRDRIERMTRTLGTVSGWRRVVVELDHYSVHARTLAEQLDVVLGCLRRHRHHPVLNPSSSANGNRTVLEKAEQLSSDLGLVQRRGGSYVVVDLRQWKHLTRAHFFWGRRKEVAWRLLRVLMKWRGVEGVGERLGVDVRGEGGVPTGRALRMGEGGDEDGDVEDGEIRQAEVGVGRVMEEFATAMTATMLGRFGVAFEGRMIVDGMLREDV